MRCRVYFRGAGILTRFPFVHSELPMHLGPPDPQLTNMAEESVPYQVSRILT